MRHLNNLGNFMATKLAPPLTAVSRSLMSGFEQLMNSIVLLILCIMCFCFGVYSELQPHEPPATMVEFCEQALNPDLTASKRALYLRELFKREK